MTEFELGQFYPVQTDALPNTWSVAYVGDFALVVQSGFACGKHGRDDGVPHLRPMNVSRDGALDLSDVKTVPPEFNEKRLRQGDVLFNNTNSPELVGKTAFVNERGNDLAFSNHMTQVQVGSGVSAEFMALQLHHLWSQKYFFHRCVKHVNQASISGTELAMRIPFVCPPTNEQRRIVEKIEVMFDEIDKGVESLKTARTTLGLYRQSLLKSAFEGRLTAGWRAQNADKLEAPETILARIQRERDARYKAALDAWQDALADWHADGEKGKKPAKPKRPRDIPAKASDIGITGWTMAPLGLLIDEPSYGTSKKSDYDGGSTGVLRIPNIAAGVIDATDLKSANFDEAELEQHKLIEGDVLTIRSNGSLSLVGKPALVRSVDTQFVYAGYLIRLRPIPGSLVPKNLVYLMMEPNVRGQVENKAKSTSGVNNINAKELQELQVPICSPAEQAEIVRLLDARLDAADALEAEIDAALTRADALRQSILKKAFSGGLVPQDPEDEPASTLLERIKAEKAEREQAAKRGRKSAPSRKPKARRPTLTDLIELLEKQKGWISAAKAAQELGIGDGSSSDDVEAFYRQLKDSVEDGAIEVERRGDEDWLRVAKAEVN